MKKPVQLPNAKNPIRTSLANALTRHYSTYPVRTIISLSVVAAASLLAALPLTAQTVELVNTFDYPGTVYTFPSTGQINDHGDYVGTVSGGDATLSGFKGNVSGSFSRPFVLPDNPLEVTVPYGINNAGLICGFYSSSSGFSGFFRRGPHYKSFMPLHSAATTIESVNDADNYVGQLVRGGLASAYAVIDRHGITIIEEPQARASGINNLNEIVGSYDEGDKTYGFFRAVDGTLTLSIDFPGAVQTMPAAINDSDYIVGVWIDDVGRHGFVIRLPDTFISYDVPDAKETTLTGINNSGQIIGYYQDAQFVGHGLVAQLIE